jgi:GLPGLI family protein
MKKTFSFFITLFFIWSSPSFSQLFPVYPEKEIGQAEIIIEYLQTYQIDSLNSRTRKDHMILLIGSNTSWFYSEAYYSFNKTANRFSTIAELEAFTNNPVTRPRSTDFRYEIFKNYPEGKITTTDHIPSDRYLYTEDLPLFEWEITDDTASISGYKVQRATTHFGGREWIAWFAPDIPYNDGPYKFNGLPGLILKIHDTRNHYAFEVVSIDAPKEKTPILFTERTYIRTTKEGFSRAWNSFRESFIGNTEMIPDSHSRHIMSENLRRNNNPIELTAD